MELITIQYRAIHKMPITQSKIDKARDLLEEKHLEETLSCLKRLSDEYKSKVFLYFCICLFQFKINK